MQSAQITTLPAPDAPSGPPVATATDSNIDHHFLHSFSLGLCKIDLASLAPHHICEIKHCILFNTFPKSPKLCNTCSIYRSYCIAIVFSAKEHRSSYRSSLKGSRTGEFPASRRLRSDLLLRVQSLVGEPKAYKPHSAPHPFPQPRRRPANRE